MQQPFRQPAPPHEPPPPSTDEVEALLKRQLARRRVMMALGASFGVLVCLSPFFYMAWNAFAEARAERAARKAEELAPAERSELEGLFARVDATLAERQRAFDAATARPALAAIVEGPGACTYAPSGPTDYAARSYTEHGSIDGNYFGSASYTTVSGAAAPTSSTIESARSSARSVRASLAAGKATKRDLADVRGLADGSRVGGRDVFVLVEAQTKPRVISSGAAGIEYDGGTLTGRAFVYSHAAKRVVCAGSIDVASSKTVDIHYSVTTINGSPLPSDSNARAAAEATLDRDLEVQVRLALASQLLAVR